jgi:hypothetical protein
MPFEPVKDGDLAFIGLNSRDNASALPQGILTKAQNVRLDRGIVSVRKGLQRKKDTDADDPIYGVGVYYDATGQERIVLVMGDRFRVYNPTTNSYNDTQYPTGISISSSEGVDVVYAVDTIFITRGFSLRPLKWDLSNNLIEEFSAHQTGNNAPLGHEFPSAKGLLYYCNRLIAMGGSHQQVFDARQTVCVSNYLDYNHWDSLDAFTFNEGSNDETIAVSPWTLNEFLVFMRNSIFYVNIGFGRYATGDALDNNSFIKTLVTDIGCSAKESVVQANGGIIFLSDNGIYLLNPQSVGSNDAVRLLTVADPLSSPIDDVIQTINQAFAYKATAIYWNNRYYLAVPTGTSEVNNTVLVYNFILKNWESVDTYPAGFSIIKFCVAKKGNQRRLFAVDNNEGIFLLEELENGDEYSGEQGLPRLPFTLVETVPAAGQPDFRVYLQETGFVKTPIQAEILTRRYTFNNNFDKRYSTVETEMECQAGSNIKTIAVVTNPDTSTQLDDFYAPANEDFSRRSPIRKTGTGLQMRYLMSFFRPNIRSLTINATMQTKTNKSEK